MSDSHIKKSGLFSFLFTRQLHTYLPDYSVPIKPGLIEHQNLNIFAA